MYLLAGCGISSSQTPQIWKRTVGRVGEVIETPDEGRGATISTVKNGSGPIESWNSSKIEHNHGRKLVIILKVLII